jgi:hypothetical protein
MQFISDDKRLLSLVNGKYLEDHHLYDRTLEIWNRLAFRPVERGFLFDALALLWGLITKIASFTYRFDHGEY